MKTLASIIHFIDRLNDLIGRSVAWMTLAMVVITFAVVVLRYAFAMGWIWMQESYVWLHGIVFMVGAGYTLLHDGHVRVDVFYRPSSARYKAWVDLFGALFLLLPVIALVAVVSETYILDSWSKLEESREAGGMPALYLLKTVLWVYCLLMGLQGLAMIGHSILVLRGHERRPLVPDDGPKAI